MELLTVALDKPDDVNIILGQTHFIKSVEDLYETMVTGVPAAKFGLAFCEASGPCLVRHTGTDSELEALAVKNAQAIAAGHSFIILMRGCFPINVLNAVKSVPEVCSVFCATANPVRVVIADDGSGRGVLGVIDGEKPKGVEGEKDIVQRKEFLRRIGYKQ
ncbi:MAG: adenosine-specific kinase [candidate division WOR-3 bacterium]